MKRTTFIIILITNWSIFSQTNQNMIGGHIISRTNQIKYNDSTGTCFIFDYENKQYFITAKHVVKTLKNNDTLEVFYNNTWNKHLIKLIGHSPDTDISVFSIPNYTNGSYTIAGTSDEIIYSQEIFFLGFPYGLQNTVPNLNDEFPIPFVKKGIISNFVNEKSRKILFLDGINNPGFSGGPIVFYNLERKEFNICGIISGFRSEVLNTTVNNKKTNIQYSINTGIIIGYGIESAIELIKANSIGTQLK